MIRLLVLLLLANSVLADEQIQSEGRSEVCKGLLADQIYIVQMYLHEVPVERMRYKAMNSKELLGEERFQLVMKLVDEAENAIKLGKIEDWLNVYWTDCMKESI